MYICICAIQRRDAYYIRWRISQNHVYVFSHFIVSLSFHRVSLLERTIRGIER